MFVDLLNAVKNDSNKFKPVRVDTRHRNKPGEKEGFAERVRLYRERADAGKDIFTGEDKDEE